MNSDPAIDACQQRVVAAQQAVTYTAFRVKELEMKCRILGDTRAQAWETSMNAHAIDQTLAGSIADGTNDPAEDVNWAYLVQRLHARHEESAMDLDEYEWRLQHARNMLKEYSEAVKDAEKALEDAWQQKRIRQEDWRRMYEQLEKEGEKIRDRRHKRQKKEKTITTQEVKLFRQQSTEMSKDYTALAVFPDPPSEPCKRVSCLSDSRALKACQCNIRKCFAGLGVKKLKVERRKWHPDRFAKCQVDRKVVREMEAKAKEVFVVVEEMYKEAVEREREWLEDEGD